MKITICNITYTLSEDNSNNLLNTLFSIKQKQNRSLAFRSGCKSGVCGSCAVRVNGVEKLACKTIFKDGDIIEPLNNSKVIKDLVVDIQNQEEFLKKSHAFLNTLSDEIVTKEDEKNIDIESNCILCSSCFSSCPVYTINKDFLGPFALTRTYRYINDIKEKEINTKLEAIQNNAIWDCTLCGNCNLVCPSNIDIKGDIEKLRNKSAQFGYNNPNMNIGFDTNLDFGFNPNGF
ncbi:MAG: 2Fe-2S iron-sulfur cluster-binding protein [Arcobacteraceae bacterium]